MSQSAASGRFPAPSRSSLSLRTISTARVNDSIGISSAPRQAVPVVKTLEGRPTAIGIVGQPIAPLDGLRHVEAGKAPFARPREARLIVAVQTGRHIAHIADAEEAQL